MSAIEIAVSGMLSKVSGMLSKMETSQRLIPPLREETLSDKMSCFLFSKVGL